jgi:hypothetical protein
LSDNLAIHPTRPEYARHLIVNIRTEQGEAKNPASNRTQGDQPASPVPHPKGVHLNLSNARPSGHTLAGVLQLLEPASTTAKC